MGPRAIRDANWLNGVRGRGYARLLALAAIVQLAVVVAFSRGGIDASGMLLGTDFISFWAAGQMAVRGENVYDVAAHIAAQGRYFGRPDGFAAFFYPPVFLLFCFPLGLVPYFPALLLWLAATGAAFVLAVRSWFRSLSLDWPMALLVIGFPPVVITILHGQTSFLVAALLGLGALWVRPHPWRAGVLIGLAVIKPQFGVLVPLVLIATGEWRVLVSASLAALAVGVLATLAFGHEVWAAWWHASPLAGQALAEGMMGFGKMISPFAAARLVGASPQFAYALQAGVSLAVAGSLLAVSWRRRYTRGHAAALLAAAPLVTPFALDYDLVLLAFPLAYVAATGFRPWEKSAAALVFVVPLFARPLAHLAPIPIAAPVLLCFYALLAWRLLVREPDTGGGEGQAVTR